MQERNAVNTNKATKSCIRILNDYITEKHLPKLEETGDADLPALLKEFYVNARQKKNNDLYHTQTMKNIRSGFQENRKVNIINDDQFNEANMIFKGVQVHAKKAGRGSRHHTPPITDEDMERLALYFNIDQVKRPNPSILQRNAIFNIIYYLCRRGQENLYEMTKDWFKVITENDRSKYVMQVRDELDKNHRESDHNLTNQGKMYEVKGNIDLNNM